MAIRSIWSSKTLMVHGVANETGAFFLINGLEIMSKMAGECESNLRRLSRRLRRVPPLSILPSYIEPLAPPSSPSISRLSHPNLDIDLNNTNHTHRPLPGDHSRLFPISKWMTHQMLQISTWISQLLHLFPHPIKPSFPYLEPTQMKTSSRPHS
jgi:hypothetical protein